jgi:hypothetical protein
MTSSVSTAGELQILQQYDKREVKKEGERGKEERNRSN